MVGGYLLNVDGHPANDAKYNGVALRGAGLLGLCCYSPSYLFTPWCHHLSIRGIKHGEKTKGIHQELLQSDGELKQKDTVAVATTSDS